MLSKSKAVEEAEVYRYGGDILVTVLVESQAEYELATALQYIHGSEINVVIWDRTSIYEILQQTPRVYMTWDPLDPNRL